MVARRSAHRGRPQDFLRRDCGWQQCVWVRESPDGGLAPRHRTRPGHARRGGARVSPGPSPHSSPSIAAATSRPPTPPRSPPLGLADLAAGPRAHRRRRARRDSAANAAPRGARPAGRARVVRGRLGGGGERRADPPQPRRRGHAVHARVRLPSGARRSGRPRALPGGAGGDRGRVRGRRLCDLGPRAPSRSAARPLLLAQLHRELVSHPCRCRNRERSRPRAAVVGARHRVRPDRVRLAAAGRGDRSGPPGPPPDHRSRASRRRVRGDVRDHPPTNAARGSGPNRVRRNLHCPVARVHRARARPRLDRPPRVADSSAPDASGR